MQKYASKSPLNSRPRSGKKTICPSARTPAPRSDWKISLAFSAAALSALSAAALALSTLFSPAAADSQVQAPRPERQKELVRFVRQECGFCHGLHLTGGLGTPLTAQALADKSREALEATILYGRTGTAMPGWTPHLSESDAVWIVAQLQKGFPE